MAGSEELYGEGHPATYDSWEADNPLYDPESKWYNEEEHKRFLAGEFGKKAADELVRIELSGEFYGDNPEDHGVWVKKSDIYRSEEKQDEGRDF